MARNIKVVLTGTNHYKTWHIFASPPSWSCDVRKSVLATSFCLPFFAKEVCRILHAETSYQNCSKLGSCLKQRKPKKKTNTLRNQLLCILRSQIEPLLSFFTYCAHKLSCCSDFRIFKILKYAAAFM